MKLFTKIMIFLVVIACAAPFVLKRSDGRPWMTIDDLKVPDISMPDITLPSASEDVVIDDAAIYKWLDQNGIMHYSDEANTTSSIEKMRLDNRSNTVHFEIPEPAVQDRPQIGNANPVNNKTKPVDPQSSPYTQIPELIDRAKNVEQILNQRQQQQEQIVNGLGK